MAENKGKITQIIGAVLDVRFDEGSLPEINEAIRVPLEGGAKLVVEVAVMIIGHTEFPQLFRT